MSEQDVMDQAKKKLDIISDEAQNILSSLDMFKNSVNSGNNVQLLQLLDSAISNLRAAYSECQSLISKSQPCQSLPSYQPQISWIPQVAQQVPVEIMKGDDPWDLFLSYTDTAQQLNYLQNLLQSKTLVACSDFPFTGCPVVICEKGQYYRGITTGPVWRKTGRVGILKIDFNETTLVDVSQLYSMPDDVAEFPCQVIRCCLSNDSSLKKVWDLEFKSHFSQLCQDFPLKIDVIKEVMQCNQPKFFVKMWISHEKANEEASMNKWLDDKLFPAMKDAQSAGADPSGLFMVLYDVLSPFSVPIDELYQDSPSGEVVAKEYEIKMELDTEAYHSSDRGPKALQDVGAVSVNEEQYRTDEPLREQIEISVEKVNEWMDYKPKTISKLVVTEPSFDLYRTERNVSTNSKQSSRSTSTLSAEAETCVQKTNALYLPSVGQRVEIYIHHVLSGASFYASIDEFSIEMGAPGSTGCSMSALYKNINDIHEIGSHPHLDSPPQVGDTLLALGIQRYVGEFLGKGKKFLRAVVKEFDGSFVEASFVDFGNTDKVPVKDLRKLRREFNSLPFQAILVKLASLEITKEREAKMELTKLIKGKKLIAQIVRRDIASAELEVILFEGKNSINNLLADKGLCTPV